MSFAPLTVFSTGPATMPTLTVHAIGTCSVIPLPTDKMERSVATILSLASITVTTGLVGTPVTSEVGITSGSLTSIC